MTDLEIFKELNTKMLSDTTLPELIWMLCEDTTYLIDYTSDSSFISAREHRRYIKNLLEFDFQYEHINSNGGDHSDVEECVGACYGIFKLKGKTYRAEYSYNEYGDVRYDNILETIKEVVND